MDNKLQPLNDKLKPSDVREIPYWVRHFLIYVVKHSASLVVTWCEQLQEATREANKSNR